MSAPKWTPGPWEVLRERSYETGERDGAAYGVIVKGSGASIGYPPTDGAICSLDDAEYIENKNAEADARLIASAPELYEALALASEREEERAADLAYEAGLGVSEWESFAQPWIEQARLALRRARGEGGAA